MYTHTCSHTPLHVCTQTEHIAFVFSQKTAFDDVCLEQDPQTKEPHGSRVFGDCDLLMRQVMRCLMPADELTKWETDRMKRMKIYDKQRKQ